MVFICFTKVYIFLKQVCRLLRKKTLPVVVEKYSLYPALCGSHLQLVTNHVLEQETPYHHLLLGCWLSSCIFPCPPAECEKKAINNKYK